MISARGTKTATLQIAKHVAVTFIAAGVALTTGDIDRSWGASSTGSG
jgi:hypothetical protein